MADKIKRDATEMKRFANRANNYNEEVEKLCIQMRRDLEIAHISVGMSDLELQAAIQSLTDMEKMIRKNLPLVVEAANKLVKSANLIEEAKRIFK